MSNLSIGWSEVSITPDRRIMLAGQFYERISEYVETPISVTALALASGDDHAVICSVDIESIDPILCEGVRALARQSLPDLDPAKIIIAATHSHTSFVYEGYHDPGLMALSKYLGKAEQPPKARPDVMSAHEATEFLIERIYAAVREAWTGRKASLYAFGFGRAAVGMNRRACYFDGTAKMWGDTDTPDFKSLEGGSDNGMELMFTYDEQKQLTGVVVNLACPAQVLEQRSIISSDYWGKVRLMLRDKLNAPELKILALCSPAGDQCPRDLVRWVEPETPIKDPNVIREHPPLRRADPSMFDIKGTLTIGRRITAEILAVLDEVDEYRSDAELGHIVYPALPLPLRRVTEEENAVARAELARFAAKLGEGEPDFRESSMMHVYAGTAARYDRQLRESIVPCEVHIMRFGDVAFATSPFELFLDFANIIRARSVARQTFLIQMACDSKGYLPTEKAERGGHYSAYVSSGHVGHEGGYMLVDTTLRDIARLFS